MKKLRAGPSRGMRKYGLKRPPNNPTYVFLLEGVSPYLQKCTQKVRPPICILGALAIVRASVEAVTQLKHRYGTMCAYSQSV